MNSANENQTVNNDNFNTPPKPYEDYGQGDKKPDRSASDKSEKTEPKNPTGTRRDIDEIKRDIDYSKSDVESQRRRDEQIVNSK